MAENISILELLSILDQRTLLALTLALIVIVWYSILDGKRWKKLPKGVVLPPHLRSYIPYFGSALQLIAGPTRNFIIQTSRRLKTPVFTATISGTKCVFIADPDLVFVVFKDSIAEIDSLSLQKKALRSIAGLDSATVDGMMDNKKQYKASMGQIHTYLIHSDHLTKNIALVQKVIKRSLLDTQAKCGEHGDWASFKMFEFVRKMIFFASIGPLISEGLINDSVVKDYTKFEDGLALLFSDAPSFVTKENVAARERLVQFLQKSEVSEEFSEFFQERNKLLGGNPEHFARVNLGVFIATVSNSIPSVFWVLFHILTNKEALEACQQEVQEAASNCRGDYFTLEDLDKLKIIDSCFKESLRIYQSFFATRNVTNDFILNPKGTPKYLIEKGSRIMAYPNTVHMDPDIFEDPEVFQYDRFLDETKKGKNGKLLSTSLRPFGGGAHLCPGRKFIGYETRAFLAMMLLHVDMKLEDHTKPGIQLQRQGFSVAHPDFDPVFQVRPRQQKIK